MTQPVTNQMNMQSVLPPGEEKLRQLDPPPSKDVSTVERFESWPAALAYVRSNHWIGD